MKMGLLGYFLPDVCARQSGSAEGLDGEIRCGTAKGQGGMLDVEHLFRVNCCPVPGVAPTCAYSHLLVSLQMCVCVCVCVSKPDVARTELELFPRLHLRPPPLPL